MRKTLTVEVVAEGADKGKVFRIKPMSAWEAEDWAWRAMSCLAKSGVDLPPPELFGNMVVIAAHGLQALLMASQEDAKVLRDEMLKCVSIVPDPSGFPDMTRPDIQNDIEEIATYLWLRDKVLEAHTGFSVAAVLSSLRAQAAARDMSPPNTPTSPPPSE
jgi:hypothetical protein